MNGVHTGDGLFNGDSWDTDVTVTNPTGTGRTYYWLIFVIVAVLGAGIFAIKKFAVDKR